VGFEVSGGYAFDRFYFEANDYHDRNGTGSTSTADRSSSGRSA
jgi:hypothetical protein